MKIVAALAWYDESVEFLDRCVRSLEGVVDQVVALDGAWNHFPHEKPASPIEQHLAIVDAADAVGIPALVRPCGAETWPSQVAKRSTLFDEAIATEVEWVLVIDGDEWVAECDAEELRAALNASEREVGLVEIMRITGCLPSERQAGAIRRLYHTGRGLHVEQAHNGYRTDDGRWLQGDSAFVKLEKPVDVSPFITLHHDHMNRGDDRNKRSLDYRMARRRHGVERWVSETSRVHAA